jgi:hypothetical protein
MPSHSFDCGFVTIEDTEWFRVWTMGVGDRGAVVGTTSGESSVGGRPADVEYTVPVRTKGLPRRFGVPILSCSNVQYVDYTLLCGDRKV